MDGLDFPVLDAASRHVVDAAAAWPIPPSGVGPMLFAALALLIIVALFDTRALQKGPRR